MGCSDFVRAGVRLVAGAGLLAAWLVVAAPRPALAQENFVNYRALITPANWRDMSQEDRAATLQRLSRIAGAVITRTENRLDDIEQAYAINIGVGVFPLAGTIDRILELADLVESPGAVCTSLGLLRYSPVRQAQERNEAEGRITVPADIPLGSNRLDPYRQSLEDRPRTERVLRRRVVACLAAHGPTGEATIEARRMLAYHAASFATATFERPDFAPADPAAPLPEEQYGQVAMAAATGNMADAERIVARMRADAASDPVRRSWISATYTVAEAYRSAGNDAGTRRWYDQMIAALRADTQNSPYLRGGDLDFEHFTVAPAYAVLRLAVWQSRAGRHAEALETASRVVTPCLTHWERNGGSQSFEAITTPLENLREVLELALITRARIALAAGRADEAAADLERATAVRGDAPQRYGTGAAIARGELALARRDYAAALEQFLRPLTVETFWGGTFDDVPYRPALDGVARIAAANAGDPSTRAAAFLAQRDQALVDAQMHVVRDRMRIAFSAGQYEQGVAAGRQMLTLSAGRFHVTPDRMTALNLVARDQIIRGDLEPARALVREGFALQDELVAAGRYNAEREGFPFCPTELLLAVAAADPARDFEPPATNCQTDANSPDGIVGAARDLGIARLLRPETRASAIGPMRIATNLQRRLRNARPVWMTADTDGSESIDRLAAASLVDALAVDPRALTDQAAIAEIFVSLQDASVNAAAEAIALNAGNAQAVQRGQGQLVADYQAARERLRSPASAERVPIGPNWMERIQERLERDQRAVYDAESRLRTALPDYLDLITIRSFSLEEVRQLLRPGEALLLIVPTEFGTHSVVVTPERAAWSRSALNRRDISERVTRLRFDLRTDVNVPAATEARWFEETGGVGFSRRTAYELYRELIAPLEPALQGRRTVFVVAGGSLASLPLSVLVTREPTGSDSSAADLRATAWLADAYPLAQLPSVQSLASIRRPAGATPRAGTALPFVGFGDPALAPAPPPVPGEDVRRGARRRLSTSLSSVTALPMLDAVRSLPSLPRTAGELRQIQRALGGNPASVHLGSGATEAALRATDLSHVSVLAFATHGLMSGELNGLNQAALVLSPPAGAPESTPSTNDGLLTASEVADMRINADWVILSACNTALGASSEAQGLSGLARAFFYAGARNLLVSHWPVRDGVAARLTVDMFRELRANPGLTRAEALQRAVRRLRDDTSQDDGDDTFAHPNAWAPFSLIGDGGAPLGR